MNSNPGSNNVRILVKIESTVGRYPFLCLQVEEIILRHPDPESVITYLRQRPWTDVAVSITLYEEWSSNEADKRLDVIIRLRAAVHMLPEIQMSEIASEICSDFAQWIADGPPWKFSPAIDLRLFNFDGPPDENLTDLWFQRDDLVNVTLEIERGVKVIKKHSPPGQDGDGEALLATPLGEIAIYRQRGYLRQGWTSLALP